MGKTRPYNLRKKHNRSKVTFESRIEFENTECSDNGYEVLDDRDTKRYKLDVSGIYSS